MGNLHSVLLMDIFRGAFRRGAPRQQGPQWRMSAITAAVVGVVLNLAIWFAIHTVFRETIPMHQLGLNFDAPKLSSVDPWSLALSVSAAVAIFRFKIGMIPTLLGSCVAGILLFLIGVLA
jgi:chromate transporter